MNLASVSRGKNPFQEGITAVMPMINQSFG
jgi:hypothetical protein